MSKTIMKHRTMYQLDGIVFSLDRVSKNEGGVMVALGDFIEIRSSDREMERGKFIEVIEKLGLKMEQGIKESYFEL